MIHATKCFVSSAQGKTYKLIRTSKMRVSEAGQTQKGEKAVKVYIGPGAPQSGSEKPVIHPKARNERCN